MRWNDVHGGSLAYRESPSRTLFVGAVIVYDFVRHSLPHLKSFPLEPEGGIELISEDRYCQGWWW